MKARLEKYGLGGLVVVLAGMYLFLSISGMLFGDMDAGDKARWGSLLLVAAILGLVAGFLVTEQSPEGAGGLMLVSAVLVTFVMWWFPVVPIVGFLAAVWGFIRARGLAQMSIVQLIN